MVFLVVLLTPNAFAEQTPVLIHGGTAENMGMNFSPNEVKIEKGDTVTWKNLEMGVAHTITSQGLFDERLMNCSYFQDGVGICGGQPNPTFSYTFKESGTYEYNCKLHNWMSGVVYVDQSVPDNPKIPPSLKATIKTDFQSYENGDLIQIYGKVCTLCLGSSYDSSLTSLKVKVQTFDPQNNLVRVDQFSPEPSGQYSTSFYSGGSKWKFEGDYTVKVNFAGEVASTTFALTIPGTPFDSPSPVPSTQSKTSTFLKLDLLDNTFTAQGGPTPLADVTYSGQLLTGDRKSYIPNSEIKLVFTGFTFAGEDHYEMTTDHVGEFDFRVSMPVGEGYGVQAVYDGSSDFKSSKSQTEYFDVRSAPLQPQPPSQPDDNPYAGIAGLLIIVVIIAGIAIGIRGARKKKPKQYQTIGGSGQQQTYQQAPPKPKATWRRKSKQKVQPQAQPDYDIDTNHCLNCGKGFMEKQPNGTKRCNHCSWDPTKH